MNNDVQNIKPIILTFENGKEYTLDFNIETAAMAEDDGFKIGELQEKLAARIPQLFYFAFKAHHPEITRAETDKILTEDLGGVYESLLTRLVELYSVPYEALMNEEDKPKNPKLTVKF